MRRAAWLAILFSAVLAGGCALQVASQSDEQVGTTGQDVNGADTAPTPTSGGTGTLGQSQQVMGPSDKPTPNPWRVEDVDPDKPTPNPWHPGSANAGSSKASGTPGGTQTSGAAR
jgi:hypothetical protein